MNQRQTWTCTISHGAHDTWIITYHSLVGSVRSDVQLCLDHRWPYDTAQMLTHARMLTNLLLCSNKPHRNRLRNTVASITRPITLTRLCLPSLPLGRSLLSVPPQAADAMLGSDRSATINRAALGHRCPASGHSAHVVPPRPALSFSDQCRSDRRRHPRKVVPLSRAGARRTRRLRPRAQGEGRGSAGRPQGR